MDAHLKAQAWRFIRISVLALLAQLLASGWVWPGWAGLWSLVPGALEAGLREVYPTRRLPDRFESVLSPAAGPGLGLPEVPPGVTDLPMRTHPGTGVPMQKIKGEVGKTVTISNETPSAPPGAPAP